MSNKTLWQRLAGVVLWLVCLLLAAPSAHAQERAVNTPASDDAVQMATLTMRPIADTYVTSDQPDSSFATTEELLLGQVIFGDGASVWRTLLRFDLAEIPAGSIVLDAELALFQSDATQLRESGILLYTIEEGWADEKATWNNQPLYESVDLWNAPTITETYITYTSPILTRVVQTWLDNPATSYGFMLASSASQSDGRSFHSVERRGGRPPLLSVTYALPPIRACYDLACLKPAADVPVIDQTTGKQYPTDEAGYVLDDGVIQLGDLVWSRIPVQQSSRAVRYLTSGAPQAVTATAFVLYPGANQPEMRLVLQKPLLVRDLQLSTQWNLENDTAYKDDLTQRLVDASDHFYRFTDGQFALGQITVFQDYEQWADPATDLWLHASNTMRPLSYIKGDVTAPTPDPAPGVDFVYEPGHMYIGSYWNRYGAPPSQPLPPGVDVSRDWAAALAHELGHYLLGQFDAYIAVQPSGVVTETFACTGSAMGYVYEQSNQAFIWDDAHWSSACSNTLGAYNVKRTEWQTIRTWFDWTQPPVTTTPSVDTLPAGLTSVLFVAPAGPAPLVNQTFDLDYQESELPSGEARAFLLRDLDNDGAPDRILDQGRPPQSVAPPQVTLIGAQANDRLCVIDIDPHADPPETPRHQFGCEVIQAGDSQLPMRRDLAWAPIIQITPLTATEIAINVVQPVVSGGLSARLYPEHGTAPTAALELSLDGDTWTGVFSVPGVTPSAFVQVWVEGDVAPIRREAIVDYGIGGGAVPGPKQKIGFAPVTASDGKAFFLLPAELSLAADEFIAIQTMAGAPPLPPATRLFGQSYRVIALPPALVELGSINIYLGEGSPGMAATAGEPATSLHEDRAIFFWDGVRWSRLPTTFTTADRGSGESEVLASAASMGVGVYAVLTEPAARLYLPTIAR